MNHTPNGPMIAPDDTCGDPRRRLLIAELAQVEPTTVGQLLYLADLVADVTAGRIDLQTVVMA